MIQIYPAPKNSNKKWIVEIDFQDIPTSWGFGTKEFDTWDETVQYVDKCGRRYSMLRLLRQVTDFLYKRETW